MHWTTLLHQQHHPLPQMPFHQQQQLQLRLLLRVDVAVVVHRVRGPDVVEAEILSQARHSVRQRAVA